MPAEPEHGSQKPPRSWPWALLALLLVLSVVLFFVYTPRERGAAPAAHSR